MNKTKILSLTLWPFLLISCASNPDRVNSIAQRVYSEMHIKESVPPKPFKSDGCSLWWDGDWLECCVRHDLSYWMGGTRIERKAADFELMHCLGKKNHPIMARFMYIGVRIGGAWWLPTPFRWGFGWNYPESGPPNKPY